ncbi:Auxin-induced protein 5NG4 [Triticum urartu]|uniref:WAT1-related protein n=1 Tax=Triticum urartu TaxID=4572 RepID=M7Z3C1_TRIUA|nr:Auxin-induced protein 5NG4 [Triticum urartu]
MATDAGKKAYVVAMVIQVIYTGMYVVSKAAFDGGMNTFVFIFYRQAAATLLLLPLAILLERRNAPPMSLWLFTKIFMYALLGNTVSMNLHNISLKYTSATGEWMKGTFLMLLANVTWSLWIVLQARLLKEYPNKLLATALQCLLSTVQSLALAAAVTAGGGEDMSAAWTLRLDVGLVAVAYSGFVVVHLGSVLGGALLVAGLYSVLWGKSKEQPAPPPLSAAPASATTMKQGCDGSNARTGAMNKEDDDEVKPEEERRTKLDSQV